jgi:hypothetical protein
MFSKYSGENNIRVMANILKTDYNTRKGLTRVTPITKLRRAKLSKYNQSSTIFAATPGSPQCSNSHVRPPRRRSTSSQLCTSQRTNFQSLDSIILYGGDETNHLANIMFSKYSGENNIRVMANILKTDYNTRKDLTRVKPII